MQRPRARLVTIGSVVAMTLLVSATAATAGPRVPRSAVRASSGPAVRIRPGARSFRIRRTDGNDVKGPLDLKALTITRGRSEDVLTFKTQAKVKNSQLDPTNGNFAIGIDTNDDQKYDYYEYFFYSEGRLRSLLYDLKTKRSVAYVAAARLSGSSFRTVIELRQIGTFGGTYRFALLSYYQVTPCSKKKPCLDAIPNRYPLLPMDHGDPSVRFVVPNGFSGGFFAAEGSAAGTLQLQTMMTDDHFGVGIGPWTLQGRAVGGSWSTVRTGTGVGVKYAKTISRTEAPGEYEYRLRAADRQNNGSTWTIPLEASFPFDESDATVSTAGTWASTVTTDAFDGSVIESSTAGDTITFTPAISGWRLCVMLGPTSAEGTTADVSVDGTPLGTSVTEGTTTAARATQCFAISLSGTHTLTLTIGASNTAPFVVDGFYVTQW